MVIKAFPMHFQDYMYRTKQLKDKKNQCNSHETNLQVNLVRAKVTDSPGVRGPSIGEGSKVVHLRLVIMVL